MANESYDLTVLSLGAGVQSSTLALMIEHGEVPMVDAAIFADTQAEPPEVYEYLEWLKGAVSFPIHIVTAGDLEKDSLRVRTSKSGNIYSNSKLPTFMLKDGLGGKGLNIRKCTVDYKIVPIKRKIRELISGDLRKGKVLQYIGISTDEASRMKDSQAQYIHHQWPLIDLDMSRADCLAWMEKHKYPTPPRSACYFCPFHSNAEWQRLKNETPELYLKAAEFEQKLQKATAGTMSYSTPYLHPSCQPLDVAPLNDGQMDMFDMECEGMCGV